MKENAIKIDLKNKIFVLISDILAFVLIMLIPTLAHLLPFPLYYLDPMRLILFGVYFANRNHYNAYLLALVLPVFSMLYSGHPAFYKAILISLELFLNIIVLHFLFRKEINVFFAVLISIVLSKLLYYLLKFAFIKWSLISGELFSTNLIIQIVIALGLSTFFFLFRRSINQHSKK